MGQAKRRGTLEERINKAESKGAGLDILNCGAGDVEIRFNDNPVEIEKASRVIQDMLKRGYSLFVPGPDGKLVRIEKFDPVNKVYIVGSWPTPEDPETSADAPRQERRGRKSLAMNKTKVIAVGRTAGG